MFLMNCSVPEPQPRRSRPLLMWMGSLSSTTLRNRKSKTWSRSVSPANLRPKQKRLFEPLPLGIPQVRVSIIRTQCMYIVVSLFSTVDQIHSCWQVVAQVEWHFKLSLVYSTHCISQLYNCHDSALYIFAFVVPQVNLRASHLEVVQDRQPPHPVPHPLQLILPTRITCLVSSGLSVDA